MLKLQYKNFLTVNLMSEIQINPVFLPLTESLEISANNNIDLYNVALVIHSLAFQYL